MKTVGARIHLVHHLLGRDSRPHDYATLTGCTWRRAPFTFLDGALYAGLVFRLLLKSAERRAYLFHGSMGK